MYEMICSDHEDKYKETAFILESFIWEVKRQIFLYCIDVRLLEIWVIKSERLV